MKFQAPRILLFSLALCFAVPAWGDVVYLKAEGSLPSFPPGVTPTLLTWETRPNESQPVLALVGRILSVEAGEPSLPPEELNAQGSIVFQFSKEVSGRRSLIDKALAETIDMSQVAGIKHEVDGLLDLALWEVLLRVLHLVDFFLQLLLLRKVPVLLRVGHQVVQLGRLPARCAQSLCIVHSRATWPPSPAASPRPPWR